MSNRHDIISGVALFLATGAVAFVGLHAWAASLPEPDAPRSARLTSETVRVMPAPTVTVTAPAPTVTVTAEPTVTETADAGDAGDADVGDGRWVEYFDNDGYPYAVAHGYGGNFTAAREAIGNRLGCDETAPVADDDWGDDGIMGYCEPALAD